MKTVKTFVFSIWKADGPLRCLGTAPSDGHQDGRWSTTRAIVTGGRVWLTTSSVEIPIVCWLKKKKNSIIVSNYGLFAVCCFLAFSYGGFSRALVGAFIPARFKFLYLGKAFPLPPTRKVFHPKDQQQPGPSLWCFFASSPASVSKTPAVGSESGKSLG